MTSGSFMEARSEGSLNLMRDSLRLSGRRPKLEQIGNVTKLTINTARCDDKKYPIRIMNCFQQELACDEKI